MLEHVTEYPDDMQEAYIHRLASETIHTLSLLGIVELLHVLIFISLYLGLTNHSKASLCCGEPSPQ